MSVKPRKSSFTKSWSFPSFRRKTGDGYDKEEVKRKVKEEDIAETEVEIDLILLIAQAQQEIVIQPNINDIKNLVTVENLCSCQDPIEMAFQVNCALRVFAMSSTENTTLLNKLADQTEDFAVQLIDQVSTNEELVIRGVSDKSTSHAELLAPMTDDAITCSQMKFVSHPLLYKRVKMRWKQGLPEVLKLHTWLLWLIVLIDTALTPLMLPLVGFAFYRDQKKCRRRLAKAKIQRQRRCYGYLAVLRNDGVTKETVCSESSSAVPLCSRIKKSLGNFADQYYDYFRSPIVVFRKDIFTHWLLIALHFSVCLSLSSAKPTAPEYLIFFLFCGKFFKLYTVGRHGWNRLFWFAVHIYFGMIGLFRIVDIAVTLTEGLSERSLIGPCIDYFYGISTVLVVLSATNILELNPVVGPLQIAFSKMLLDFLIILVQFCFVFLGFAMAITKIYKGEEVNLTSRWSNHSGESVGKHMGFVKVTGLLLWSVFEQTDLKEWESEDKTTSDFVAALFCIFLIISVIMLVNMLVALLTKTYDNIRNNGEVEWKFSRAVVEKLYRGVHAVPVPFNLLTVPATALYLKIRGLEDARKQEKNFRWEQYKIYYQECLFPIIIPRYKKKYGGSFPLSVEEKMDSLIDRFDQLRLPTSGEIPSVMQNNQHEPPDRDPLLDPNVDAVVVSSSSNKEERDRSDVESASPAAESEIV